MTLSAIALNLPALVAGGFSVIAWICMFVTFRTSAKIKHKSDAIMANAAFVEWARWTYLSVTDKEGKVFYRTLYDLQDELEDMIWDVPVLTVLFRARADEPDPYGFDMGGQEDGRSGESA